MSSQEQERRAKAVFEKHKNRRPTYGDLLRLYPDRPIPAFLVGVLQYGEVREIIDDERNFEHVPYHVRGPSGRVGFAGPSDVQVLKALMKGGRPAGTDAAYWPSRVDQIQLECRLQTIVDRRHRCYISCNADADVVRSHCVPAAGQTVVLPGGRVGTVGELPSAETGGWLEVKTDDGMFEFFFCPGGRTLQEQLTAPWALTKSLVHKAAHIATATSTIDYGSPDEDICSDSGAESDAVSEPATPKRADAMH
jgi:hypothetical protein